MPLNTFLFLVEYFYNSQWKYTKLNIRVKREKISQVVCKAGAGWRI